MSQDIIKKVKSVWEQLAFQYTGDKVLINSCWDELLKLHTGLDRHYHNLVHVHDLIVLIEKNKGHILNYHSLLFSAFYHDAIYEVSRKDNENRSAQLAEKRLAELMVDKSIVELAIKVIRQTATHKKTSNFDIDIFLDFDRCILASAKEDYRNYKDQIRKEYSIFSDSIYRNMRKIFLQNFLSTPEIFYTTILKSKEKVARENLQKELEELSASTA